MAGFGRACAAGALLLAAAPAAALAEDSGGIEAADTAAKISPFRLVIARLDTIDVTASVRYANASRSYEPPKESRGLGVLFVAGAVARGLDSLGVNTGDYHLATDALIGRAFIMLADPAAARPWLESALAQGEALDRSDAELSGILRDLAWLADKRGDAAAAETYRTRADTCARECKSDLIWRVSLDAEAFRKQAEKALGKAAARDTIQASRLADGDAFIRATVAPGSLRLAKLLRHESTRVAFAAKPALLREAIGLFRANGMSEEALWPDRLDLIGFLVRAGESEAAVSEADALIGDLDRRPADDPAGDQARRAAADAAAKKFDALKQDEGARRQAAYRQAVDRVMRVLAGPDVSAHDLRFTRLVESGVAVGFDADAKRLARALLAFRPGETRLLTALHTLAARSGDAGEAARLAALVNPTADDARTRALAHYAEDGLWLAETYPEVVAKLEWLEESYAEGTGDYHDARLAGPIGAATVALGAAGSDDDRIAADVVLGRFFLARGDLGAARRLLTGALDRLAASGRGDAFAATLLRDLTRLERRAGHGAAADGYDARAGACPLPCSDDLMAGFVGAVRRALRAAASFSPKVKAATADGAARDAISATETVYGGFPDLVRAVIDTYAYRFEATRPWRAIELYQRLLDLKQAAGETDVAGTRYALAKLLLQVNAFDRLVAFIDSFEGDLGGGDYPAAFTRLRARALWEREDPGARDAYAAIVADTAPGGGSGELLKDLLDARYSDLVATYADLMLAGHDGAEAPLLAKARLAADDGRFDDAAALLDQVAKPHLVTSLQRARYLAAAGRAEAAAALRATLDLDAWARARPDFALDPPAVREIIDLRDYGAYEGAAEGAKRIAVDYDVTGAARLRLGYRDAQILWQIAYTLVRGGEVERAFALMKTAAETAARISFEAAGGASGGSLQLLRRDRYNYLLFVDIAWAWTTGQPPQRMSISSRY